MFATLIKYCKRRLLADVEKERRAHTSHERRCMCKKLYCSCLFVFFLRITRELFLIKNSATSQKLREMNLKPDDDNNTSYYSHDSLETSFYSLNNDYIHPPTPTTSKYLSKYVTCFLHLISLTFQSLRQIH